MSTPKYKRYLADHDGTSMPTRWHTSLGRLVIIILCICIARTHAKLACFYCNIINCRHVTFCGSTSHTSTGGLRDRRQRRQLSRDFLNSKWSQVSPKPRYDIITLTIPHIFLRQYLTKLSTDLICSNRYFLLVNLPLARMFRKRVSYRF